MDDQNTAGAADTATVPPTPGTRIRVTHVASLTDEPTLYVGAVGTVGDYYPNLGTTFVTWDDAALNDSGCCLLAVDRYEVVQVPIAYHVLAEAVALLRRYADTREAVLMVEDEADSIRVAMTLATAMEAHRG